MKKPRYELYSKIAFGLVTYIPLISILILVFLFLLFTITKHPPSITLVESIISTAWKIPTSLIVLAVMIIWFFSPFLGWFFEIPALFLAIYSYKNTPKNATLNMVTIVFSLFLMTLQALILIFPRSFGYPGFN